MASPAVTAPAAGKAAQAPPANYQVTKSYELRSKAASTGRKLSKVQAGAYLVSKGMSGQWMKTTFSGTTGWYPLSHLKKLPQPRYDVVKAVSATKGAGSGSPVAKLGKGTRVYGTGRVAGKHTQIYSAGRTGWVKTSALQRPVVAKYQTKHATPLYAGPSGTKRLATIPADYTVATRTNKKSGDQKRVAVEYGHKPGWLLLAKASKVSLSTKTGKLSFKQSAAKYIAKWCKGVPIDTSVDYANQASYWSSWDGTRTTVEESINLSKVTGWGAKLDANHALAVAIQYHECAHILQYRAYKYDGKALDKAMNKAYGKRNGTEHMADCMADVMGARQRQGRFGSAMTYTAATAARAAPNTTLPQSGSSQASGPSPRLRPFGFRATPDRSPRCSPTGAALTAYLVRGWVEISHPTNRSFSMASAPCTVHEGHHQQREASI